MHSTDSLQIFIRKPSDHIFRLTPNEERDIAFQVDAHGTTSLYASIRYFKEAGSFHWDSSWIRELVLGNIAELESILVSNPYGTIGRELEIKANIKGLDYSDGLDLQFWADTPSGEHEEIAEIKTKHLSPGEDVSYTAKITIKEKGYYTVYGTLYDHNRRIGRKFDIIWTRD